MLTMANHFVAIVWLNFHRWCLKEKRTQMYKVECRNQRNCTRLCRNARRIHLSRCVNYDVIHRHSGKPHQCLPFRCPFDVECGTGGR